MNRNKISKNKEFKEIMATIKKISSERELITFFKELLTSSEINILSKRWCIMKMLADGCTQREISKDLKVSLCKVTRGAKILKNKKSVILNYLTKENKNG